MTLDTTRDAAEARRNALAGLSGAERLQQALDLSQFVADFSAAGAAARAAGSNDAEETPAPDSSTSRGAGDR